MCYGGKSTSTCSFSPGKKDYYTWQVFRGEELLWGKACYLTQAFLQLSIEQYFVSTDSASFVNKNVVNSYMMSYLIGQKHTSNPHCLLKNVKCTQYVTLLLLQRQLCHELDYFYKNSIIFFAWKLEQSSIFI